VITSIHAKRHSYVDKLPRRQRHSGGRRLNVGLGILDPRATALKNVAHEVFEVTGRTSTFVRRRLFATPTSPRHDLLLSGPAGLRIYSGHGGVSERGLAVAFARKARRIAINALCGRVRFTWASMSATISASAARLASYFHKEVASERWRRQWRLASSFPLAELAHRLPESCRERREGAEHDRQNGVSSSRGVS
jgi:hypothetical protein